MEVNGVDREVFKQHWIAAAAAHSRRSAIGDWSSDYGPHAEAVLLVRGQRAERARKKREAHNS
jgi:hypothetical protein